jgi:hypothetical protein
MQECFKVTAILDSRKVIMFSNKLWNRLLVPWLRRLEGESSITASEEKDHALVDASVEV